MFCLLASRIIAPAPKFIAVAACESILSASVRYDDMVAVKKSSSTERPV